MKDHSKFAELATRYAMSLGYAMGGHTAMVTGKASIVIPKHWIRELCGDQLDEQEYIAVKTELFKLLRSTVENRQDQWQFDNLHENGDSYVLAFRM
jgi:hypothetical protein